jgi:hypothetical protein
MPPTSSSSNRTILEAFAQHARRMRAAQRAPRCQHVKADGVRCGSPALTSQAHCYAHAQMLRPAAPLAPLPPLEDANGIQCALMQVADALVRDQIDYKRAALLLYCLQIASANLKRVRFEPLMPDDVVRDAPPPALANDQRRTTNDCPADARLTGSRR